MAKYLLDSTVLIDILRGRANVVQSVEGLNSEGHVLGICAVNVTEVFSGLRAVEREKTEQLLTSLVLWDISYDVARAAGEVRSLLGRRGRTLSVPDALVASVAIANEAVLLTANVKDFAVPGLEIDAVPSQ